MDSEEEEAGEPIAVVLVSRRQGREFVDAEHKVRTLQELYDLCHHAAPGQLTKVYLRGPDGEIRLNFASFIARRR
ncbi:MAG TPA: hypothetical protein VFS78_17010 [Vicinamibacteria bacterium]|nr:hypothetical protein [Vicinamibacteria bacterium]